MKLGKICIVLTVMLCVYAQAQWLETTIPVGSEPVDLIYNPTNNKIYSANEHSDDVTVIDGVSNTVITTVYMDCDGPRALVYNTNDNKIYCANRYSDNISIIDGTSNAWHGNIAVGHDPSAITYNSLNNKVYCANSSSGNISVIDCNNNTVIATIPTGGYPHDIIYSYNTNKIYCADLTLGSIFVIDGETDTIITAILLNPGGDAGSLGINEINHKIYCGVCAYHHYGTHVIDSDGDTSITYLGNVLDFQITHNPVNNQVYIVDARAMVTVVDGVTDSIITTIATDDWSIASICNQTNNKVYVANENANNVTVIDCESNTVCTTIDVEERPCALAWNYVQNRVYVANFQSSSVSVIRDVTGIAENSPVMATNHTCATIFSGPIIIPEKVNCKIFNTAGRQIHTLNPVSGIYFIEVDGKITRKVIKVK